MDGRDRGRVEIFALSPLLQQFGPQPGRPRVDTPDGSRRANMKELRFSAAAGEWRVAFAFHAKRDAILLVAGDKAGSMRSGSTANSSARPIAGLMRIRFA